MTKDAIKMRYRINFAKFVEIATTPQVSATAFRLLTLLLFKYARTNNNAFPSQNKLAKDLGISPRHIRDLLSELKYHRIVVWKRRGYSQSNKYFFNEELYFLNDDQTTKQLGNPSSALLGGTIPLQNGSEPPPKILHENTSLSSDHLRRLFWLANKNNVSQFEQNKFLHYCKDQDLVLVEYALNITIQRNRPQVNTGYISKIVNELKLTGIPAPKPTFHPCQQNGCDHGFIPTTNPVSGERILRECSCHATFKKAIDEWKQRWGETFSY